MDDVSGPRARLLLPALVLATMTTAVVSSLGAPLVPEVAQTDGISIGAAQWTLTATLLAGAISIPILGRLGNHRYRRPVVLGAIGAAVLGTLIAALPLGFAGILTGRILQGIGMGVTPVAIALARTLLPPAKQASALSLLSISVVVGAGLGYPLASFFATAFGLAAAYWFGFGVSLVTFALAFVAVPGARDADREPPIDWFGAVLLSIGSVGLLLAITQGEHWGVVSPPFIAVAVVAVFALVVWARRSLRIPNPLIDLRLTVRRGVLAANLVGLVAGTGMYMLLSTITLLVQSPVDSGGFGQTAFIVGLMFVPYSLASFFGSRVNLALTRWISGDLLLPIGCAFYAGAMVIVAVGHTEIWAIALAMVIAGLGSGATFAAMPGLILRYAKPTEGGSAMSANQLLRSVGFSIGSALAGTILSLFIVPGGSHPEPAGFTVVAVVAAALMVAGAVVSFVLGVRDGAKGPGPEEPEDPTALEI